MVKVFLQLLGTDTGDACPTILLFFDNQRYLFGCGEGTQRFCTEHRVRLARVSHIFLPQVSWEHVGGLPGMLLSLADIGTTQIALHGPRNTAQLLAASRYFICRHDMSVDAQDFLSAPSPAAFSDENVRVHPLVITARPEEERRHVEAAQRTFSTCAKAASEEDSSQVIPNPATGSIKFVLASPIFKRRPIAAMEITSVDEDAVKKQRLSREPQMRKHDPIMRLMPATSPSETVVCYIVQMHDLPGKFDPVRATALGVQKGPMYGKLQKGETVTLPSGAQVKPSDCISAPSPGPCFAIVCCPDETYVTALISHPGWETFRSGRQLALIVHWSAQSALASPAYAAWLKSFGEKTQHVIVNRQVCAQTPAFISAAKNHVKTACLNTQIFPEPHSAAANPSVLAAVGLELPNVRAGQPLLKFHLAPIATQGFDTADVPAPIDRVGIVAQLTQDANWSALFEKYNAARTAMQIHANLPVDPAFELVFLGTGAALPSKYRNVSGTFVLTAAGGVLLDCGEGSLGQLYRRYGPRFDQVLLSLRLILISHIHADHHLGLIRLVTARVALARRNNIVVPPMLISGPPAMQYWLHEYQEIEPFPYTFIPIHETPSHTIPELALRFDSVPVIHCLNAVGYVVSSLSHGWRVVFSGDTRPCAGLVAAGKGATIVVHEATFENEMMQDAQDKNHSTTGEAIDSAVGMNAPYLLMNHFSQRYPRVPLFDHSASRLGVAVAFDFMSVTLANLPLLTHPATLDCLRYIYREEDEEKEKEEKDDKEESAEPKEVAPKKQAQEKKGAKK